MRYFKIIFAVLGTLLISIIVLAVYLNDNKVSASTETAVEKAENLIVVSNDGYVLEITSDSACSAKYSLSFNGINEDGSFNQAKMEVTYTHKRGNSFSSNTIVYYSE